MCMSKLTLGRFAILIHFLGNSGEDEGTKTMPYAYFNLFHPLTRLAFISRMLLCAHFEFSFLHIPLGFHKALDFAILIALYKLFVHVCGNSVEDEGKKLNGFVFKSMFDPSTHVLILCFYVQFEFTHTHYSS